ncbi:WAT1-related protein At3g28050-like [Chenopodium quinoa]|uniref:WAT1-related protein At3g28050-like n=1 Tax=Chenopodium quinoa TaxID=63459 RepID=UPI000B76FB29|nr:WAT1-related protein At3g28050-like [Chenopodium quinoa]
MWEMKLGVILLTMEGISVSTNTLSKAAMAKGMSNYIFTTYTHAISLFFLVPLAFFLHRKTPPPPIGWSIIMRLFLLGVLNCGCSIFLFVGIRYSSPTLASAMNNLSPAFTFIIAIILRMELVNFSAQSSVLKSIGTIVSIIGAFIVTFYQGQSIIFFSSPNKLSLHSLFETQPNWAVGALLLATSSIFLSLTYIAKTWIARDFHSEVLITLISCFFETIVAAIVTLIAENDASVWTPTINIEIISILFGAFDVGIVNTVNTWACRVKGSVFVAMFKPLQMIIAVILGVSFLGDVLHVGSVIGGIIIALGFYTVMKGKAEEETHKEVDENRWLTNTEEEICSHKVPMLQNRSIDA